MTSREKTALVFVVLGVALVVVAAYGYGGWRAAALTGGVVALAFGVLLGLDERVEPAEESDVVVVEPTEEPPAGDGRYPTSVDR